MEGGLHHLVAQGGRVRVRVVGRNQVHRHHQAQAAHLADRGRPLLQVAQPPRELRAPLHGIGQDVLAHKDVQRRDSGGARNRVAAEGRAVRCRLPLIHELRAGDHRTQGQA